MTTALILDNETTALIYNRSIRDDKQPEIIEFYAELVDLANGTIQSEFETLIRPSREIPEEVIKITNITNEMVADKPQFSAIAPTIFSLIESAPIVIAHNASFDAECLDIEAARIPYKIKWPRLICSVEQTNHLTGKRLSLGKLHEHLFGERFADAHRAKTDVKALTKCCVELYKNGELI